MHRSSSRHAWPLHAPIESNSHRPSRKPARTSRGYQHGSLLKPGTPPSSRSRSLRRHSAVTLPWSGASACCRARFSVLLMKTSSVLGLVVTRTSSRKGCRSCWTSYYAGEGALTSYTTEARTETRERSTTHRRDSKTKPRLAVSIRLSTLVQHSLLACYIDHELALSF